jgi:mRNA interferase HicA
VCHPGLKTCTIHPKIIGLIFVELPLNFVIKIDYVYFMKSSEFKRWLTAQGATFEGAKGSHLKVKLNGKTSFLPMHSKELKTGTLEGIKKQPGLK